MKQLICHTICGQHFYYIRGHGREISLTTDELVDLVAEHRIDLHSVKNGTPWLLDGEIEQLREPVWELDQHLMEES